jgi:ABC-type uncharacterized transport system
VAKYSSTSNPTDTVIVVAGGRHKRLSLEGDLGVIDNPEWHQRRPGMPNTDLPVLKDYKGEEALSSALKSLLVQGKPVLYFLRGHQERQLDQDVAVGDSYGAFRKLLEGEVFEVKELELGKADAVPKDASLIVALEPRIEFSKREAELLYGWLQRGGRLFLNYSYLYVDGWNPSGGDLGRQLGFEVGNRAVFHLVSTEDGKGKGGTSEVIRLTIRDWAIDQGAKGPGILHGLSHVHPLARPIWLQGETPELILAREILPTPPLPANVHHEELLRTGPAAWLAAPGPDGRPSYDPPSSPSEFRSRLVGTVIEVDGEGVTGRAVVVSGAAFCNFVIGRNGDLGGNIVNWLTERKELVTVRGSRYEARNLKVSDEQIGRIRLLLVVGVPLLFSVLGSFVRWRRSRAR